MADNITIKAFVQKILGCRCPEDVFRSIDIRRHVRLNERVLLSRSITIGNRLLIYVIEPEAPAWVRECLGFIVSAGKKERDSRGLNRFRLVVATDDASEKQSLLRGFEELQDKDEKTHLHVITKEENII
jgi:hypothetical protein